MYDEYTMITIYVTLKNLRASLELEGVSLLRKQSVLPAKLDIDTWRATPYSGT